MLSLTITMDSAGVATLSDAGYQIVLLADTQPAPLLVACLLNPIGSQSVTWDEAAEVYVSMSSFKPGQVISINSQAPAAAGTMYQFASNQLTDKGASSDASNIQLSNLNGETVTGGLAATFTSLQPGSPAAVTGASILNNAQATFEVRNDFLISAVTGVKVGSVLLASDFAQSPKAMTSLSALSLTPLPFASQDVTELSVRFNSATNQFEAPT